MAVQEFVQFYSMKGECRNCKQRIWWVRGTCPECKTPYPTSRPTIYWAGMVVFALSIPTTLFWIAYALGLVK